jgi:hypothetical protein
MPTATPEEPPPPPVETEVPVAEDPPRELSVLLGLLKCATANFVVLSKASGGLATTMELAREMDLRNRNRWVARAGSITIGIGREERDLLEAAGAEPKIRDFWSRCPRGGERSRAGTVRRTLTGP